MAQKAAKQTARRNTSTLNRTHLITAAIHTIFILLRFIFRVHSTSLVTYVLLSLPSLIIEFWLERIGRPSHGSRSGEDLNASGLTEYMWDVLYWTWGCIVVAAVFGDKAWWMWVAIPLYSIWLAYSTFGGLRQGLAGMTGQEDSGAQQTASKRQAKMEKRGAQRVSHRP
ncbi:MAG: hypothetical protein M1817_004528 [Caeruleum heppii]|nr:MAG: hypothetical protein M1817_004528 [Caeruleum heppii]